MKKISLFALLGIISAPAFAEEVAPVESVADDAVPVAQSTQDLKEEIKAELKQEFKDTIATKKAERAAAKHAEKIKFPHGLQFGVGSSATSGLNGFVGYANKNFDSFWAKRFGVRFDFATTRPVKSLINNAIDSVVDDGIDIGDELTINDGKIDAKHMAAMVDFYPFGDTWFLGGWRLTGGYYMGEMSASAAVAGTINELDGGTYEFELMGDKFRYTGNSVHGTAELDWDYRGPYIGTGFDIGLFAGFKIYVDAGVVLTNRAAELDLNVPFTGLEMQQGGVWKPVENTELESVVNGIVDETLSDAQSELDDIKYYPMVKVGFMYRF
ncbi:MAG: hypothetical protein IKB10_02810 [Alphaproteobacteria bacterium]|nr:hypothetical protein [Alphaproteobacteria bacterium]